jgi:hypothetical protein
VLAYSNLKVIALHHCANCPNRGVPITSVIAHLGASLPACAVSDEPALAYQSHTSDDTLGGDGDGEVEAGETIVMPLVLENVGSQTATGVSATLSTSTPGISLVDASASFPDIAGGGTGASQPPHFTYAVDAGVACGTDIDFGLAIDANEGSWSDSFSQVVGGDCGCIDLDGDGYGNPGDPDCPAGGLTDCNDANPAVNPGAIEIPGNGVDDDCNQATPGCGPQTIARDGEGRLTRFELGAALISAAMLGIALQRRRRARRRS